MRRTVPAAIAGLAVLLAACAGAGPERPRTYAFRVPPNATFDLGQGRELTPEEQIQRLAPVRLLFLGENHQDTRSHRAHLELLQRLHAAGRTVTVALEMFPPAADSVLEAWRTGELDEPAFVERSGWYDHWGHPWAYYRDLFLWFRDRRIALHGVNADDATRSAARSGKTGGLPSAVRDDLGDLNAALEPHQDYLFDTLRGPGHGGNLEPGSPQFRSFLRVQTAWDRLMGRRAARLAEQQPPQGIVAVLIGAGHLVHKIGANLRAAQTTPVPQVSLWQTVVPPESLDASGRARVPLGMADWARVSVGRDPVGGYPSVAGVKLKGQPAGVLVEAVRDFAAPQLKALQLGDTITALNGEAVTSAERLRMAFERLPWNQPATLSLRRAGADTSLTLTPRRDE